MCAEYEIRTRKKKIDEALDRSLVNRIEREVFEQRIKLSLKSPVLVQNGDELELIESLFPVRPFPNARLSGSDQAANTAGELVRRIYDRPTWKKGFTVNRCVIVMSAFFEPSYWGRDAGSVMRFAPPQGDLFFVAGIQIDPQMPKVKPAHALLTHTASPQMLTYHHRLLVLLPPALVGEWLSGGNADPIEKFDFLTANRITDELRVEKERTMAKGWEKRVDHHLEALEQEKAYRAALTGEGVEG